MGILAGGLDCQLNGTRMVGKLTETNFFLILNQRWEQGDWEVQKFQCVSTTIVDDCVNEKEKSDYDLENNDDENNTADRCW